MAFVVACGGASSDPLVTGTGQGPVDSGESFQDAGPDAASTDATAPPQQDATTENAAGLDSSTDTSVGDGALPPAGDPCPNQAIAINCSATCGVSSQACALATCRASAAIGYTPEKVQITTYSQLPMVIRTPNKPGVDPHCAASCSDPARVPTYAIAFRISLPTYNNGVRILVGDPWKIGRYDPYAPGCKDTLNVETGCTFVPVAAEDEVVWTDDPNAPVRNIVIEEAPAGQQCP